MGGRLERGRGQRTAEIRLVESDDAEAGRRGVVTEPAEGELVRDGEQDEGVGRRVPGTDEIGVGDREIESRVCRLTGLGRWRQVTTGDQVEAGGRNLTVRHAVHCSRIARRRNPLFSP